MGDVPQLGRSESRPLSMVIQFLPSPQEYATNTSQTSPEAITAAGPEALPHIDYRPTTDSYRSTTDSYRPIPDPYRTSVDMHRPFPSSIDPDSKKIYCTYWLRNGECDYMQQGCRYKHEMPDMETLKSIGFLTIPRWYREKLQYDRGADRPRQDEASLRKVLERSGLVGRDSKVVRSDESEDEEVVCPVPAPRLRVVGPETQISAASSPREKENKETILQRPLTPETRRSSDTSSDATFNNGDLFGDFEDSSDETSSPTVPRNTPEPEQRPFREGRFVPSNERVKPAPVDVSVRTPSPLVLEHTVPKPQSPDVKTVKSKMRDMHINTPVSTTPKPVAAVKAGLTQSRYATPTRVPVLPRQVSKNEKPVRQSDRVRTSRANERPRRTTRGVVLEEVKKREKEQKRKVEKEEEVVMGYKPMFKNHKF